MSKLKDKWDNLLAIFGYIMLTFLKLETVLNRTLSSYGDWAILTQKKLSC